MMPPRGIGLTPPASLLWKRRIVMKNVREYFRECFESERPRFVNVMKAVPADQAAYKPHPRSTSAGDIVWLLASELRDACELIDHGEVSFVPRPAPSVPDCVAQYEKNAADLAGRLATVDDAKWDTKARFLVDGNVAWETTLGNMLYGFLFDAIHHRGQLSSYLRPMGAKVPSIYGPSADDPGQ
jgi:hypothetical protein